MTWVDDVRCARRGGVWTGEVTATHPALPDDTARRRLLVSIHDVGPRFESEVDALAARLEPMLGGPRFAMLGLRDQRDEAPLARAPRFAARLRSWSDAGVEMFLHGWRHRDDSAHTGAWQRWRATRMTAGEGEFLGLDRAEARNRMRAGRAVVEDAIGRPVAGFIAPAWLYGEGAHAALRDENFAMAEDHLRDWNPARDRTLARGPVITWASRSGPRIASSLFVAALARRALARSATVRIAVHPGDVGVPHILASIDRTVGAFAASHRPARYAELAPATAI
jgi:predicted deacetylase